MPVLEIDPVLYHLDDKPNWSLSIVLGLQYVIKFALLLSLIFLLMNTAKIPANEKYHFMSNTLLVAALCTILQAS